MPRVAAILVLKDGTVFRGTSIGAEGMAVGEVVFNTAMTGYQEILTDPSYSRQLVTLTYPHIGNTGANAVDVESDRIYAAGLIIRDLPLLASSWRMQWTLPDYLKQGGVPAIADIDTRRLTRLLRDKDDAYDDYTRANFETQLERRFEVIRSEPASTTRRLYFARRRG